mgnify:CR=1 FL=1
MLSEVAIKREGLKQELQDKGIYDIDVAKYLEKKLAPGDYKRNDGDAQE